MSFMMLLIFPVFLVIAALSDLLTMRLSNRLTLTISLAFLLTAWVVRLPWMLVGQQVSCGFFMLLIGFGMFSRGWIGGGDAKLLAALAAWLGWGSLLDFILMAAIFGGVFSFLVLQWRRWPLSQVMAQVPWLVRLHHPDEGVPYGVALAFGAFYAYPQSLIAAQILHL